MNPRAMRLYKAGQELMGQAVQIDPVGCGAGANAAKGFAAVTGPGMCGVDPNYSCYSCRVYPLIVDSGTDVKAGTTVEIPVTNAQFTICMQKLVIASDIAPFFILNDVSVGMCTTAANKGRQYASVYSEVACCNIVNYPCVGCNTDVSITVTNIDDEDHLFLATFFGTAAVGC